MVTTTSELEEMEDLVEVLEGAYEELPTLIFILKLSLHQARAQLRNGEPPVHALAEVEVEAEGPLSHV